MDRIKLKSLRKEKHYTQRSLAEKIGISPSFYGMIEANQRRPSVKVAKRMADVLGFYWTEFYVENE